MQSHYIEVAQGDIFMEQNKIWASVGPVGNTEKKMGAEYEQLLGVFFFTLLCFERPID